jgi:hypothetical protein
VCKLRERESAYDYFLRSTFLCRLIPCNYVVIFCYYIDFYIVRFIASYVYNITFISLPFSIIFFPHLFICFFYLSAYLFKYFLPSYLYICHPCTSNFVAMYIYLPVTHSIKQYINPSINVSSYLSTNQTIYVLIYSSVCLSSYLPTYSSIDLST